MESDRDQKPRQKEFEEESGSEPESNQDGHGHGPRSTAHGPREPGSESKWESELAAAQAEFRVDEDDDDDRAIPHLPRGRGISFAGGDMIRIAMFTTLLIAIIVLREPCSQGVARFMSSFEVDAGLERAPLPEGSLIRITGDETDEELRKKLGRDPDAGASGEKPTVEMDAGVATTKQPE